MGLGYYFNSYRGQPVVRKGGAVILYHPLNEGFNQLHHPSYVDFYEEVLAESTDPAVVGEKYEQQFAQDPWYIHLYRTSHAYHGVHPFYMWYWAAHAMDHVDEVIWVGGDRRVAARLGFRAAIDPAGRAGDGVRHGRYVAVDHLPAQPAAPAGGRAMSMSLVKGGVADVKQVARGWRWGRRGQVPRSAEPFVLPSRSTVFRSDWSRRKPAMAAREVAQKGGLRAAVPLAGAHRGRRASTSSSGSRARSSSWPTTPRTSTPRSILLSLPDEWRRKTAVAAAADYFFDTWWRAVGSSLFFNTFPIDRRGGTMATTPGEVLADGWSLVIFPEGTRSHGRVDGQLPDGRRVPRARARRARRTGRAPRHVRRDAARPGLAEQGRRQLTIRFGEPLRAGPGEGVREFAPRIKDAVAALLDEDRSTWWESRQRAAAGATPDPSGPDVAAVAAGLGAVGVARLDRGTGLAAARLAALDAGDVSCDERGLIADSCVDLTGVREVRTRQQHDERTHDEQRSATQHPGHSSGATADRR